MAKCVRIVGQGVPVRMSDDDAFTIVHRDLDGEYCPKSFWQKWYDENHRPRAYSTISPTGRIVEWMADEGFHAREAEHAVGEA